MRIKNLKEKLIIISGTTIIASISLVITLSVYNVGIKNDNQENIIVENIPDYSDVQLTESQKVVVENLISKLDEIEDKKESIKVDEKYETNDDFAILQEPVNAVMLNETNEIEFKEIEEDEEIVETFLNLGNKNEEFICLKPIDGEVMLDFSETQLVYSKTLDEWSIHEAVDFIAPIGSNVYAVADGKISALYDDYKYGCTMHIEHDDGYVSKYCGIDKENSLNVGDRIKMGDTISKVEKNIGFEAEEENHLHFELLKDGKTIRPNFK